MSQHEPIQDSDQSAVSEDAHRGELAVLREENQRLRAEYRRARQHQHRQSALALAAIAAVAALAAVFFPGVRDVLLVLGAIGAFGAALTYYLTPDRVTTASVVETTYDTHAETLAALTEELGLQDDRVYVPVDDPDRRARLFVPQHADYTIPDALDPLFLVTDDDGTRGVSLPPVGAHLLAALEPSTPTDPTPDDALAMATESLVEQFALVDAADYDLADGHATITVSGPRPDDLTRPDHPAVSLPAVALATTLDQPVSVATRDAEQATLTWPTEP